MADAVIDWMLAWGELSFGSGVMLALLFVVANLVLFPRSLLYLAVGAIFGPPALAIVLPSTTVGAILAFLASRYLFFDLVQRQLDRRPRLRAIADAVDSEGWRVLALIRVGSPIPGTIQNCLFGITRIGLWPYTFITFVFTIPPMLFYASIGAAGRLAFENYSTILERAVAVAGLLCMALVAFLIWRKARMALRALSPSSS